MCSKIRGPAICPSFVTCPIKIVMQPEFFANTIKSRVHSRSCVAHPGVPASSLLYTVWIESITSTCGFTSRACSRIFSRFVSQRSIMSLPETFKRSLRSFTWHALSSPLTYSALTPAAFIVASVVSTKVDLPMPGSPPISTRLPGAKPPPSTRSNSEFAVLKRRVSSAATSFSSTTLCTGPPRPRPARPAPSTAFSTTCSLSVLHAPQNGHFPAHLGVVLPHSVQRYTNSFFDLFTATMCTNITNLHDKRCHSKNNAQKSMF